MSSLHRACCCDPGSLTCTQWCACLPDEVHISLSIVDSSYYKCGPDIMSSFDESLEMFDIQLLKSGCTMVSTTGGSISYSKSELTRQHKPYGGVFSRATLALCQADPLMNCTGADLCTTYTESGGGTSAAGDLQINCFDPCGNTPAIAHSRLYIQPYLLTAYNQSEYGPCGSSSFNGGSTMRAYGSLVGAPECLGAGTWKRYINWDIAFNGGTYPVVPTAGCGNYFDGPQCDFLAPSRLTNWNHDFSITCTDTTTGCGTSATCFYPNSSGNFIQCLYPPAPPTPIQERYWSRTFTITMTVP